MALFEVISKNKERRSDPRLNVPAWMGGETEPPGEFAPAQAESPPPPSAELRPTTARAPGGLRPAVTTSAGQLTLSLNYTTCCVAFLVLLAMLFGAFLLGQSLATKETPMTPEAVAPSEPPRLVAGKHYLLVQKMAGLTPADEAQAKQIAAFLAANGEQAVVRKFALPDRKEIYGVLAARPFERKAGLENDDFARKIDGLGAIYFNRHGKYRFEASKPLFVLIREGN
ncbi:MAG TPA: hypothetical protein DCX07_04545 [Phycisphaerales bacterium]|nr:hypothetical protein [Phycisphaerales bacterium]